MLVGRAYKLKEGEPVNPISSEKQRALAQGMKKYGIEKDTLLEYLELNYVGQEGKPVKSISDILEKDYSAICDWIVDVGTVNGDMKEELTNEKAR